MKGGPFGLKQFSKKIFTMRKKLKGGTLWGFSTPMLSQNIKKIEGGYIYGEVFVMDSFHLR